MAIATSTIQLWKNVVLTPDKNYAIEDIEDYLGEPDATITDFQFLELKNKMTIKIVLSQYNLQFDSSYNINYCHISRQEEESFSDDDGAYYFIKQMTWKGVDTIELDLEMDVLNTFGYDEDYSVSDKTMVKREHKDRFSPETTFAYKSNKITLAANQTKTITIQTPITKFGGVKSVSNVKVTNSRTGFFIAELNPITEIAIGTEYYFKTSAPSDSASITAPDGSFITFRTYDENNKIIREAKVQRIRFTTTGLYAESGIGDIGRPFRLASVAWADYPDYSVSSLGRGRWTFEVEGTPELTNSAVFLSQLQGTVLASEKITATPHILFNTLTVQLANSGSAVTTVLSLNYTINGYIADIDLKSEGINPPLYKKEETNLEEPSGVSWSLLYKNSGTPNQSPVDCFLYPSSNLNVLVPSVANSLTKDNVPGDKYAVLLGSYNTPQVTYSFTTDQGNTFTITPQKGRHNYNSDYVSGLAVKSTGSGVEVWVCTMYVADYGSWGNWEKLASNASSVSVSGLTDDELHYYPTTDLPSAEWVTSHWDETIYATGTISMSATVSATLYNKDYIDRTDEKNIKLITLPYAPTPVIIDEQTSELTIGGEWFFNSATGTLKFNNLNYKFKNTLETKVPRLISSLLYKKSPALLGAPHWNGTDSRFLSDPKLLHSDYYYKKFVYDSFSKIFRLESLNWKKSIEINNNDYFSFDFVTSRNIVSKFLFMFPEYITIGKGSEDYDNMLAVARNNEEVLFNSQYLNYLRTGYNYDLKTKERQEATGAATLGLSIASLIGSIALTASGYGAGFGIAGIVGSIAGIAGSAISYAKTTAQAEDNIQRKLQETQNQAVSVLNADDYDLLETYSGNIAKMCTYQISDQMNNALDDMFYYAGYVTNEQLKPQVDTRYWFNFLQADLVVDTWKNISTDIQEAIKQKFSEGVTFFHCHTINSVKTWNIAQTKENIEKWIALENGGAD